MTSDFLFSYDVYPLDKKLILTYKNNRFSRITGGFLPIPGSSGGRYHFTDIIYWDVIIIGDQVKLEKKSSSKEVTFDEKHELRYDKKLITERRIIRGDQPISIYKYEYENDLLKKEYKYLGDRLSSEKTFYFNEKKNLDSIVHESPYSAAKNIEIFTDYDKKTNKIKGIMVLEELLPRALSRNNYLKKTIISISESGERTFGGERTWGAQLF